MNLQVPPDAPLILHLAAGALLVSHIGGGAIGMVSGATAMIARKGGRLHRLAGRVFTVSMLVMAGIGAAVAPFLDEGQWTNTTAGVFTLYLTMTAWLAGRRRDGEAGRAERWALFVPVLIAAMAVALKLNNLGTVRDGGFTTVYVIGAIAAVAAAGDINLLSRGGLAGSSRLARHIWRMSLAMFVATGSFFFGQQEFLPAAVRGTFVPALAVLPWAAVGMYWFARTRFARAFPRRARRPAIA